MRNLIKINENYIFLFHYVRSCLQLGQLGLTVVQVVIQF
jgi:hypothetical protein